MAASVALFKPEEHLRNLKGQPYLEVKYRAVWFRELHPDGYIATSLIAHITLDADAVCVFRCEAGWTTTGGVHVYATGHAAECRSTFADYREKSETAAVGRALALLGFGTQFACELAEGERAGEIRVVDSPVPPRKPAPAPATLDALDALRAEVETALAADVDARDKLPKPTALMSEAELRKTRAWLARRAAARVTS